MQSKWSSGTDTSFIERISSFVNIFICLFMYRVRIYSFIFGLLCRTNFSISEDAHVILTQSEHGLYAYVCVIFVLLIPEVILLYGYF